jgi:hypothetical protein
VVQQRRLPTHGVQHEDSKAGGVAGKEEDAAVGHLDSTAPLPATAEVRAYFSDRGERLRTMKKMMVMVVGCWYW